MKFSNTATGLLLFLLPSLGSAFSASTAPLQDLNRRLTAMDTASSLISFYEPPLKSFSVQPGASTLSITSTCYALLAIQANPTDFDEIDTAPILQALVEADWRTEDLFQVPLLLYTILKMDDSLVQSSPRVQSLVDTVLQARPRRRMGSQQSYSDYILFRLALCYTALYDQKVLTKSNEQSADLFMALSRCAETSFAEVCRQLALRAANDRSSFDIMRLVYSLLTYVVSTRSIAGTAGRESVQGAGPDPDSRVKPSNDRIVKAALNAFFQEQNESGLWDKGQPIYRSFRRTGRSVGNAFIFSTDTLCSVLETLDSPEYFRPYLQELSKSLQWIESHQVVEIFPDYCDVETGECYGKTVSGWKSPHLDPETGPQGWSTAQTVNCVENLQHVTQRLLHIDVLEEFGGKRLSEKGRDPAAWDRLLDADLGDCGTGKSTTLKEVLSKRMIGPLLSDESSIAPCYSSILFGPPGTAKTTIAESLARKMGWDFLVIDTSCFLADGLTNVASRIRYVFDRLQYLEDCVILFDEIEEFCLDRETPGLGMESRMLTTAMLTAINDLRRRQSSVFFLATNRLRAFDAAITRPGRFDLQLFVGTPNLDARKIQFEKALSGSGVDDNTAEEARQMYMEFLEYVWDDEARFMNYLEGVQFANACVSVLKTGRKLTQKDLTSLLRSQATVMTIRGPVREEFLASMGLTRL